MDIELSDNYVILENIRNLWFYIAFVYFSFYRPDRDDRLYFVMVFMFSFVALVYSMPVVFNRYAIFLKILFSVYLIQGFLSGNIKRLIFCVFLMVLFFGFLVDVFILRDNFIASYSPSEMATILGMLTSENSVHNFLY